MTTIHVVYICVHIYMVITFFIHLQEFPLYVVSSTGEYDKVELFLQQGAKVDQQSDVSVSVY